jgi:hypothetical protein
MELSSWTILLFGVMAFVSGIIGIFKPNTLLKQMNFETTTAATRKSYDYTMTFMIASSVASTNMGAYYILAALSNIQQFYMWTVPFRIFTFIVFTWSVRAKIAPSGFIIVAITELIGSLATFAALVYERV